MTVLLHGQVYVSLVLLSSLVSGGGAALPNDGDYRRHRLRAHNQDAPEKLESGIGKPRAGRGVHLIQRHVAHQLHSLVASRSHSNHTLKQSPTDPLTTTTTEDWSDRMGNAFFDVIIGWVMILFSIPILWFNERRNARMESVIMWGESQCQTITADHPDKDNRDRLVHIQGANMVSAARVKAPKFDVEFEKDCVRLRTHVQAFQVIEHEHSDSREKIGGGRETITKYTYSKEWSSTWHDSRRYRDPQFSGKNTKPGGLDLGWKIKNSSRVELGDGFLLTDELINQCNNFNSVASKLGPSVSVEESKMQFFKGESGWFYHRDGKDWHGGGEPQIGDCRVRFECVPDGQVTVMALQVAQLKGGKRDVFLPYRLISRGLCGISEEKEKLALKAEGQKTRDQLASDASCNTGIFCCLCCACNLVAMCCSSIMTPEINHLFEGSVSMGDCFQRMRSSLKWTTWGLRIGGWLVMFLGLNFTFSPFVTFIKVIPFLGPPLAQLGSFLLSTFSFIVTVVICCAIVSIAYMVYHPLVGLLYILVAGLVVALPVLIGKLV